jgi:hypothetical protein
MLRWEWHVSWMSERKNIHKIFLENLNRRDHLRELSINGATILKSLLER